MSVSLKPLKNQVMVITGASSGIGLATAKMAAKEGTKVVLAARNENALAEIEREINASGGKAFCVVCDVTRKEDLRHLASAAIERFGGFDTWVNNAAVSIYGRLEEISEEDHRQLFDINFWGVVNGSLIAVEHLKKRGGALINLGSVASDMGLPLQAMYSASKHAIKGFTDALRMELEEEGAPVSITLIKPTSINTPYPEHAKNYLDEEPSLPPPVYQPEEVARAICHAAAHPKRDIFIGGAARMMSATQGLSPRAMDKMAAKVMTKQQKSDHPARHHEGTLYEHGQGGRVHGNVDRHVMKSSLYTRSAMHPFITGAMVAFLGTGLVNALGKKRTRKEFTGSGVHS